MSDPEPTSSWISTNSSSPPSDAIPSDDPPRGRTLRRDSSGSSDRSSTPDTSVTSLDALELPKSPETSEKIPKKTAPIPDKYKLSVRASDSIFFPIQVDSTLLWNRSAWFRTKMTESPASRPFTLSATGLISFYAADSIKGKMITVPFTSSELLESYIHLLETGEIKFPPRIPAIKKEYSLKAIRYMVQLYIVCVYFEDSISMMMVVKEAREELTQFREGEKCEFLGALIGKLPAVDGEVAELPAIKRQLCEQFQLLANERRRGE